ncbi:MAG: hypothetical protein U0325_19620 [Polyangiales bacterium]
MGEDLVVLLLGALSVGGAAAASFVGQHRRRVELQALDPVWGAWCARRGFAFEPARGLLAPRVQGDVEGVHVSVDAMELDPDQLVAPTASARERRRMPHTSVAARPHGYAHSPLQVMSRARLTATDAPPTYRRMDLADARFDEACAVWAAPGAPARALEDRTVRAALARLAQRPFVLLAHGGMLWIRWPGYERDPEMLDHALTALVAIARAG